MRNFPRVMLGLSLALNVAAVATAVRFAEKRGGMAYVSAKLSGRPTPSPNACGVRMRHLPCSPSDAVIVGDSIAALIPWGRFIGPAYCDNRASSGSTTENVLWQIDSITGTPGVVAVFAGVNDIHNGWPLSRTLDNYRRIVAKLRERSPTCRIYVFGVMPSCHATYRKVIVPMHPKIHEPDVATVAEMNRALSELEGVIFVPTTALCNTEGLDSQYTDDGLHLNLAGARVITHIMADSTEEFLLARANDESNYETR